MTTFNSVCTIEPVVPSDRINAADLELFRAFGLDWELTETGYYLFSNDFSEFGHLDIDDPREMLRELVEEYPVEAPRPDWVNVLSSWLEAHVDDTDGLWLEPGEIGIQLADILQGILTKPGNQGENPIEAFVVNGAYTASRLAPGSHGGWSTWIDRDGVSFLSTHCHEEYLEQLKRVARTLVTAKANSGHTTPLMTETDRLLELLGMAVS